MAVIALRFASEISPLLLNAAWATRAAMPFVTVLAMGALVASFVAAAQILLQGHGFQVHRIDAEPDLTQMIDGEPIGDRPNVMLVGPAMRCSVPVSRDGEPAVATVLCASGPQPALPEFGAQHWNTAVQVHACHETFDQRQIAPVLDRERIAVRTPSLVVLRTPSSMFRRARAGFDRALHSPDNNWGWLSSLS